jgi:hypothetical protein
MNLQSFIRHLLTGLLTIGTLFAAWKIIPADQIESINQAGSAILEPLVLILSALAIFVWRWVIAQFARIFPWLENNPQPPAGGPSPLWILGVLVTAAGLGSLPSCTPANIEAFRNIPIEFRVDGPRDSTWGYSSKHGVEIMARIPTKSAK